MVADDETITIIRSLKTIVEKHGVDVLNNGKRANAFLMDYIPKFQRERKLIVSALNEGIGEALINAVNSDGLTQQQIVTRSIKQLTADLWIAEEAAIFAVNTVALALGYDINEKTTYGAQENNNSHKETNSSSEINKELVKGDYHEDENLINYLINNKYSVIGYKALSSMTTIERLEIPEGIKVIKNKAFMNCFNLQEIKFPSSIEQIGFRIFDGCNNLKSIIINNNDNYCVANYMFIDRKNKRLLRAENHGEIKMRIPEGIQCISGKAFECNQASEIIIPASITDISVDAFYECYKLRSFSVAYGSKIYCAVDGVLHSKDTCILLRFPIGKKDSNYSLEDKVECIAEKAFSKAANLMSITFNSRIRKINKAAFEYCVKLETVMLPGSIYEIGERAFQYCSNLKNIMLARNITEIGDFAFCQCENLRTVSIPQNVEIIGNSAFWGCKSLESVIIQGKVRKIGDCVFDGCSANLKIKIKNNTYMENYCRAHRISFELI